MTKSAKNKQVPQRGALEKKQATSTELTGGASFTYEDKVSVYYLVALLRGEKAMLQRGIVSSVAVQQAAHGQPMDDLIVEFRDTDGPRMLGLQVKSTITVSGAGTNKYRTPDKQIMVAYQPPLSPETIQRARQRACTCSKTAS